ncbi:hypothetical protein BGT96224_A21242 [Blumeria graminis f. sp. tritici 96224]|uniref:Uncharacterized protein n=1 Tax=Blumeria graminis f. sp. tritici 96224 TaxID=1268274 RepID=A0A656KLB2_BLUGR|nr:hypothetical protein BGT96224_A21242 [Blumeria graminis f. sp. tritici 96224]
MDSGRLCTWTCQTKDEDIKIFAASVTGIIKALVNRKKSTPEEIKASLPPEIEENAKYFDEEENYQLPPHRPGVDTRIEMAKDDSSMEKEVSFEPLHEMSWGGITSFKEDLNRSFGEELDLG